MLRPLTFRFLHYPQWVLPLVLQPGRMGRALRYQPRSIPHRLRGTGTGTAAGLGRIASILAPLIVPPLISFGGTGVLFAVFAVAFLLAAITTFALPEKRGKSL